MWCSLLFAACLLGGTAAEDSSLLETSSKGFGIDVALDANLDRISEKLNNERMHRLLSIDGDTGEIPGLKDLLKDDDVTLTARKAVRSAGPIIGTLTKETSPRLKQKMKHGAGGQTRTDSSSTTSLEDLAKRQRTMEKQLKEIEKRLKDQTATQQKRQKQRLKKLKAEIVAEVMENLDKDGQGGEVEGEDLDGSQDHHQHGTQHDGPSFRERERSVTPVVPSMEEKKKVLLQLQHTLQALKNKKKASKRRFSVGEPHYTDDWHETEGSVTMQEDLGDDDY